MQHRKLSASKPNPCGAAFVSLFQRPSIPCLPLSISGEYSFCITSPSMHAFTPPLSSCSCVPFTLGHKRVRPHLHRTQFFTAINYRAYPCRAISFRCACEESAASSESPTADGLVVNSLETFEKARALLAPVVGKHAGETKPVSFEDGQIEIRRNGAESTEKVLTSHEIASTLLKSSIFFGGSLSNPDGDADEDDDMEDPLETGTERNTHPHISSISGQSLEERTSTVTLEDSPATPEQSSLLDGEDSFCLVEHPEQSPQNFDIATLNTKKSYINERRHRAARLNGTDDVAVANLGDDSAIGLNSDSPLMLEISAAEPKSQWLVSSMKTASIISARSPFAIPPYSALTSIAAHFCFLKSEVPFQAKPFPALRQALFDSNSVKCSLCKYPILKTDLQAGFLCSPCYSEIFVEIDSPTAPLPRHKALEELPSDVRSVVDRIWQEKASRKRRSPGILTEPKMTTGTSEHFWKSVSEGSSLNDTQSPIAKGGMSESSIAGGSTAASPPRYPPPPLNSGRRHKGGRRDEWVVNASLRSLRTINPIRNLVQGINVKPNPAKELIKLSVGDPTLYGNLKVNQKGVDKYCDVIRAMQSNGYSMSMGSIEARTAVAHRYSLPEAPLTPDDVFLSAGTSGAVELAIGALANEGDNILVPQPGFPLFRTIAESFGVECRYYKLLPTRSWEIDLAHLATLADSRTVAIVVNNPSNPCGSVFNKSHIQSLLQTAENLHLPIIADEVYADMVFAGREFFSVASLSEAVPIISVGGISKQFVVPGWRLGWVLIHDRGNIFELGEVRKGIRQLTTRMLVPNTPAQAVLPTLLNDGVADVSFRKTMRQLEDNASFTVKALATAPGLRCIEPQGSMYTMVEIDAGLLGFANDLEFTKALLQEESVFVLPGQCFKAPNFVRIVFCAPQVVLSEAFHRIRSFCSRHAGVL